MRRSIFSITLALISFAPISKLQAQDTLKIGYIDESYVLENLPDFKKAQEVLKKYYKKLGDTLNKKQRNLQGYFLNRGCGGPRKSKAYIEEQAKELNRLRTDLQQFQQKVPQLVKSQEQMLFKPIYQGIEKAVRKISEQNDIMLVLKKETLLYQKSKHNISNLVLRELGVSKD